MNHHSLGGLREMGEGAQGLVRRLGHVKVPMAGNTGLLALVKEAFNDARRDHLEAFAGNVTFNVVLAIFPFFLFLVSLLGIFHQKYLVNSALAYLKSTTPPPAYHLLHDQIVPLTQSHAIGTFTLSTILWSFFALWGISWGFGAIIDAMNAMYQVEETRPMWQTYLISAVMSVVAVALLAGALVLVVFGPGIGATLATHFGQRETFWLVWTVVRWPLLLFLALLAFTLVYWSAPDTEQCFTFTSTGAVIALAAWLVFSLLFTQYVTRYASYGTLYGAFTSLVVLLLYLYYSSYILLFGAEINQVLKSHAAEQQEEDAPPQGAPQPPARETQGETAV